MRAAVWPHRRDAPARPRSQRPPRLQQRAAAKLGRATATAGGRGRGLPPRRRGGQAQRGARMAQGRGAPDTAAALPPPGRKRSHGRVLPVTGARTAGWCGMAFCSGRSLPCRSLPRTGRYGRRRRSTRPSTRVLQQRGGGWRPGRRYRARLRPHCCGRGASAARVGESRPGAVGAAVASRRRRPFVLRTCRCLSVAAGLTADIARRCDARCRLETSDPAVEGLDGWRDHLWPRTQRRSTPGRTVAMTRHAAGRAADDQQIVTSAGHHHHWQNR